MSSRKQPPGPKGALPGLTFLSFSRDPLGFLTGVAREYGDVVFFGGMSDDFYLLNHPDFIKDVLVTHHARFMKGRGLQRAKRLLGEGLLTSEPPLHRRQRRLAQPAFHKQRINAYASLMVDYALRLERERWEDGRTLDAAQEMMHLTLAVVGRTLFGTETEAEAEEVRDALSATITSFAPGPPAAAREQALRARTRTARPNHLPHHRGAARGRRRPRRPPLDAPQRAGRGGRRRPHDGRAVAGRGDDHLPRRT
jgi:cytochrome P450